MTCDPWPCEWCGGVPPEGSTVQEQQLAAERATEVLHALSGYQFSRCRRTFTISGAEVCTSLPYSVVVPRGAAPCCAVEVGHEAEVHEVTVDGVALAAADWWVSGRWLVKADGSCWPTSAPCDPPRTVVDVTTGQVPPKIAARAVGELAEQIIASCTAGAECVLPSRVVSVNRQGISMSLLDPMDYLNNGKLGLAVCDTFLMSVNPDKLRRNAAVLTPDTRRVAWLS